MATEYCLTYKYTGQTNVHNSMIVAKSKFTLSGDTTKKIGRITKITYHHYHTSTNARTWRLYGKLYFSDGTYITSDTVSKGISGNVVNYVNTFTTDLPGPDKFATWTQIQTVAANPSESIDIYWRATTDSPMYVKVYFEEGGASITDESGNQVNSKAYVWKTTNPRHYYYPAAAMTANSSQGCIVTADSNHSTSYPTYYAFSKTTNCWCSANNDNPHWIQIQIPKGLYNIKVKIGNRVDKDYVNGLTDGIIYGLGADGTLTQLLTISGRAGGVRYAVTEHELGNTTTPYYGVRIEATKIQHYSTDKYLCISDILVMGSDIASNGAWVEAQPLIWKTDNPKTYTYPSTAMNGWNSAGCSVCASSCLNNTTYSAWKAFNKATSSSDIWFAGSSPMPHWLQLTMPRPLYNISVSLTNRYSSDNKGGIDGIIYGSNDDGGTLVQIGSFTGRDPATGKSSTITCNNTTTAYKTVRVLFTKWGDANGNPVTTGGVGVGAMSVTGTDIGTNGGWANINEDPNPIVRHPVAAMSGEASQDCIAAASSKYNASYSPAYAFNRSATDDGWISLTSDTAPWLRLTMPEPLYNIKVTLINRSGTAGATNGPIDGTISGSNDGTNYTVLSSFSGRNGSTRDQCTSHCLGNKVPYNRIKIDITNWYGKQSYAAIAEAIITGTRQP